MSDTTITSYPLFEEKVVFSNDDIPRTPLRLVQEPIGTECGCTCHPWPGTWGKNEPDVCCGTLHRVEGDKE